MVYTPDRVESIAPVSAEEERGSGRRIRSLAQQEFEAYLTNQVQAIAPARIDRVDATTNYTYLSAIDEDQPAETLTRLIVQLEDCQGNEHLVDVVTNNDRLIFLTRVIRNTFDPCWKIAESWTPAEPF
jgi:hypothetical protein